MLIRNARTIQGIGIALILLAAIAAALSAYGQAEADRLAIHTTRVHTTAALVTRPGLPVLFTTGYTKNAIVHGGRLDSDVELLNKPYTRQQLAAKVRALIEVWHALSPSKAHSG